MDTGKPNGNTDSQTDNNLYDIKERNTYFTQGSFSQGQGFEFKLSFEPEGIKENGQKKLPVMFYTNTSASTNGMTYETLDVRYKIIDSSTTQCDIKCRVYFKGSSAPNYVAISVYGPAPNDVKIRALNLPNTGGQGSQIKENGERASAIVYSQLLEPRLKKEYK